MPRWLQRQIVLTERTRGVHLITDEVLRQLPEIYDFNVGLVHFFLQHTSASLAINERADDEVRTDLNRYLDNLAPEHDTYMHNYEGPDDMPAHIKAALTAVSLAIPVMDGRLALGTWQGIYLFEHRSGAHVRRVVAHLGA